MGWSEPENKYFPSHDIGSVLYIVLLYSDILFHYMIRTWPTVIVQLSMSRTEEKHKRCLHISYADRAH